MNILFVCRPDDADGDDYQKCLEVLTSDGPESVVAGEVRKVINAKDRLDNTALHYATQMWPESVVQSVLQVSIPLNLFTVKDGFKSCRWFSDGRQHRNGKCLRRSAD